MKLNPKSWQKKEKELNPTEPKWETPLFGERVPNFFTSRSLPLQQNPLKFLLFISHDLTIKIVVELAHSKAIFKHRESIDAM